MLLIEVGLMTTIQNSEFCVHKTVYLHIQYILGLYYK